MKKEPVLILDKERIKWKLKRMAYQVWEQNTNEESITLVGISGGGFSIAKGLASALSEITPLKIDLAEVSMNKKKPLSKEILLKQDITGKAIVLVDDVANSGKTLLYALKPILNFEPKKITIAVLVDRRHKSFPIVPDIVGHSVSTTMHEHISVETDGDDITGAYLH